MYRTISHLGGGVGHVVFVDGYKAGTLGSGDSLVTRLTPGEHQITVVPYFLGIPDISSKKLTINVENKKINYIRYDISPKAYSYGGTVSIGSVAALAEVDEATWLARR